MTTDVETQAKKLETVVSATLIAVCGLVTQCFNPGAGVALLLSASAGAGSSALASRFGEWSASVIRAFRGGTVHINHDISQALARGFVNAVNELKERWLQTG